MVKLFGKKDPASAAVDKIVKPVMTIYNNVICAVKLISRAQKCMVYYLLDMIGYILYFPFMIFFWMFALQSIEREIFKGLDTIDSTVYGAFGFHIFRYPNSLMNDCYRCKNKKESKGESWLDKYLAQSGEAEHRITFFEVMFFFCMMGFFGYCGYYYFNIKKSA